uniref:Deoxyribonuclease-1 n=1 Tax=Equus caballus TaxID=9796 RepID=A0A9L0SYW4_HORSE
KHPRAQQLGPCRDLEQAGPQHPSIHPACPSSALLCPLPQILNRYDIALIQEVRDSHLTAVGKLLDRLNQDDPNTYHFVVSEPLGRNNYKERYLFVFRPDQVSLLDSYQYNDGCEPCGNDTFSREPAIVKFSSPFTQVKEFAIVPLHAAPSDALAEIDSLYDVYLDVQQKWDMEDIMLMGDFNAGCSYVTSSQWPSIRLRRNPAFWWLIPDIADTTVKSTHCAYDRSAGPGPVTTAPWVGSAGSGQGRERLHQQPSLLGAASETVLKASDTHS